MIPLRYYQTLVQGVGLLVERPTKTAIAIYLRKLCILLPNAMRKFVVNTTKSNWKFTSHGVFEDDVYETRLGTIFRKENAADNFEALPLGSVHVFFFVCVEVSAEIYVVVVVALEAGGCSKSLFRMWHSDQCQPFCNSRTCRVGRWVRFQGGRLS